MTLTQVIDMLMECKRALATGHDDNGRELDSMDLDQLDLCRLQLRQKLIDMGMTREVLRALDQVSDAAIAVG